MKPTRLLSAISAAALLGISSVALAQGTGSGSTSPGASSGAPSGSTLQRQEAPSGGMKANQAQGKEMGNGAQKSQAQGASDSKSQMSQDGAKSGTTVGAAGSGAINLTAEQRTTIRQEVLTANAPRANNINFSVNVGTVVPSSVRVVEVPPAIIKIRPAWKGYRYFVYNDEIVIVEPRTLKIVAVLDV